MHIPLPQILAAVTAFLVLAACGSGSEDSSRLTVDGVVTRGGNEVRLAGSVTCRDGDASGSGSLAAQAGAVCRRLDADPDLLDDVGPRRGRLCTEIFGGPQTARIRGHVEGRDVRVTITRSDGCGIADWDRLEWLLGPPDR